MFIIKGLINFVAEVCFFILVVYGLFCVPMIFGYKPLVIVEAGGMFNKGTLIYCNKVDEDVLTNGDIILYNSESKYIPAIIQNYENGIFTVSHTKIAHEDTNVNVTYNDIYGKDMNIHIPVLGYFMKFIQDNTKIVVICVCVILFESIFSWFERMSRKKARV